MQLNVAGTVYSGLASSLESELQEQAVKQTVRKAVNGAAGSNLDWTGTGEQLPALEKAGLLGLKVLSTLGATAAIVFLPYVCIPVLCHSVAYTAAAAVVAKGVIAGSSTGLNDYLTKQINGNYTPDPEKRKEYTDGVSKLRMGLSVGSKVFGGPVVEAGATLLETGAVFVYDSAPEKANDAMGKIKNLFSSNR